MERSENVILTNMCMVCEGRKVLVEEKIFEDGKGIVFPGGHVEMHEPLVDSVIREIYEETNLTDRFSGELKSSDEGQVFWTDIDTILELPVIWHMDRMLRIFDKEEFAELFLEVENGWKPVLK